MGRSEPLGNRRANPHRLAPTKRSEMEPGAQRPAFEQFHHRIIQTLFGAEIENRKDIGMRERGHGFGLTLEAAQGLGVLR
jgi:hypothetical protein